MKAEAEIFIKDCINPEEKRKLEQRLKFIEQSIDGIQETVDSKIEAQKVWSDFHETLQDKRNEIKELVERLNDKDLSQSEISSLQLKLVKAEMDVQELGARHCHVVEALNGAGIVLRDRETQKIVDVGADLESLLQTVRSGDLELSSRMEKLMTLEENSKRFDDIKERLFDIRNSVEGRVQDIFSTVSSKPTLEELQSVIDRLKLAEADMNKSGKLLDEFRELGKRLGLDDPSQRGPIEAEVSAITKRFQDMKEQIAKRSEDAQSTVNQFQKYEDLKSELERNMTSMEPMFSEETAASNLKETREKLDKFKVVVGLSLNSIVNYRTMLKLQFL